MKQNIKKWMLLILYLLVFPIGLQISFFLKKYVSIPVYNFVDRKLEYYQLLPVYVIFSSILSGLFIIFMIVFSRKIAKSFSLGMLLPISIVFLNLIWGIPMFTITLSPISYFFNKYNTKIFYFTIGILLILLLVDKKLYNKK